MYINNNTVDPQLALQQFEQKKIRTGHLQVACSSPITVDQLAHILIV